MGHSEPEFLSTKDERCGLSPAQLASRDPSIRKRISALSEKAALALRYSWRTFWARPNQILNLALIWTVWIIQAGRGWGKTRVGAEAVRDAVELYGCRRIALIAPTARDTRDTMVDGESGIIAVCSPENKPIYLSSKARLVWPNGAQAFMYSGEKPNRIRGPQFDFCWIDELAAMQYPEKVWDNIMFSLRLPSGCCRVVITTTPTRTCKLLKELARAAGTLFTRGSTYDNLANLSANLKANILRYVGTSKEREEIFGEDEGDVDGAYWSAALIDRDRITNPDDVPKKFIKIAIGLDPNTTKSKDADDVGICLGGLGEDGYTYILGEYGDEGSKMGPNEWGLKVAQVCDFHYVNLISLETNAGGDTIKLTILNALGRSRAKRIPQIKELRSQEDKSTRCEPVVALQNAGMIRFCGSFPRLEGQLTGWVPNSGRKSPGALDSFVFLVNALNPSTAPSAAGGNTNQATDFRAVMNPRTGMPVPGFLKKR